MTLLDTFIMAVVQGITEFLPVSSSGHLVLTENLLGLHNDDILLEIFLHFGTFLSVLLIFRKDIWNISTAFIQNMLSPGDMKTNFTKDEDFRLSLFIIVSMIPAALAGFLLKDLFESLFNNLIAVSFALLTTGAILFSTRFITEKNEIIDFKRSILIGIAQAFAIIPGISRSGSTISLALILGIPKEKAARFSFIMALPVVFGATLMESLDADWSRLELLPIFTGTVFAFFAGYGAIKWLLKLLVNGKFHLFAWYCFAIGAISLGVSVL